MEQRGQYASAEKAAQETLRYLSNSGDIERSEAGAVKGQAFAASQLDSNHSYLYDNIGPTKAVSSFSNAISLISKRLASA